MPTIEEILRAAKEAGASDVHTYGRYSSQNAGER